MFLVCFFRWSFLFFFILSSASLALAQTRDLKDEESPFGVLAFFAWNHEWNHYHFPLEKVKEAASLMREAGIHWVRMDFLWADIEPEQARFDFKKYDGIVNVLKSSNIHILGILEYNPDWRKVKWNSAPDRDLYIKYASRVVGHFKDRVKYWEIWNEPDERTYWEPHDNLKAYSLLLKETYTNLKKVDPECRVLCGSFSASITLSLRRLYRSIGKDYFDIVNIHPFVDPLLPSRLSILNGIYLGVIKTMKEFGDANKPIWFTEIGCPGVKEPDRTNGWWNGMSPTEQGQADWVALVYQEALKWGNVKKVFWAFFRDTPGHFKNGVDYFGLVDFDLKKKPSFEAYKKVSHAK